MNNDVIHWYPGHMAKARRLIEESMSAVDIVYELIDARIPASSQNPDISSILSNKPSLLIMTKSALADPAVTEEWIKRFEAEGRNVIALDIITGEGMSRVKSETKKVLAEKLKRNAERGMTGKRISAMILGVPNVGKSSLMNKLSGTKKASVENRPGVTRGKQWVSVADWLDLLDMPGILWGKFGDRTVGENLAITGAIKDDVLDCCDIAVVLCRRLRRDYPDLICGRYKIESIPEDMTDAELLELIGKKRGFLVRGGDIDYERTANMLLDEFRSCKIGRISLERPQ